MYNILYTKPRNSYYLLYIFPSDKSRLINDIDIFLGGERWLILLFTFYILKYFVGEGQGV